QLLARQLAGIAIANGEDDPAATATHETAHDRDRDLARSAEHDDTLYISHPVTHAADPFREAVRVGRA
ncbi:MAG: hypothetical protein QOD72_3625, partial [Acidimicrobiaceae bacterium]|nr:hypothetical protein [Acidimicrobiaceae bacterium]